MADENILGGSQAVNAWIQQQTKHIEGQPVRVYPFKIVSGLSYFTNKGQKPLGSNPGNTNINPDNTATNDDYSVSAGSNTETSSYGAYSGVTTMYSGAKPLICYWFGVTECTIGSNIIPNQSQVQALQTKIQNAIQNEDWELETTLNQQLAKLTNSTASNRISTVIHAHAIDVASSLTVGEVITNAYFTPDQRPNPFNNNEWEFPWKELGLQGFSISSGKEQHSETLDNLKIACYDTTYDYTMFSNSWVPNFQEINEFVYFIVDVRCACPLALRISSVEPHYDPNGILQDCTINFSSINQYYNNNGRNVLTYVKFGGVGDGYAFPMETFWTPPGANMPELITVIDPNLLNNSMGGVNQIEVKNNSLTGQFGALVYGHPYEPFQAYSMQVEQPDGTVITEIVPAKTTYADDYLLPWKFTAPCTDIIDVASENVHSVYDLAMNMLVINEQVWGNWKSTKEYYNITQNFTFQGGLAFDDPTVSKQEVENPNTGTSSEEWISTIFGAENNVFKNTQTIGTAQYNTWVSNNPAFRSLGDKGYGSMNIATVLLSNANGYSLDKLCDVDAKWPLILDTTKTISGFALPQNAIIDLRSTGFTAGLYESLGIDQVEGFYGAGKFIITGLEMAQASLDLYYSQGFMPPDTTSGEIWALQNEDASQYGSISPTRFFVLNSFSMINTHQLEINYRDGIVYKNTDQGHNGLINDFLDMIGSIADKWMGYTPGSANFFMNTYARTYNLLLPHMITMLAEQYINPTNAVYNAIPLDIFANTNDNNTSVGQLKYISGYQYVLTNWFLTTNNTRAQSTVQMRHPAIGTTDSNGNFQAGTRYVNPLDPDWNNNNAWTTADTSKPTIPLVHVEGSNNAYTSGTAYEYAVQDYANKTVGKVSVPYNSLIYFQDTMEPLASNTQGHISYVIDEVNVKQLGISNLHITYWKEVPTGESVNSTQNGQAYATYDLQSVGEEWIENTSKMMNNTSYIDNDIDYYIYDKENSKVADNCEPYLAFQFPPDPMVYAGKLSTATTTNDMTPNMPHIIYPKKNATCTGVSFKNNVGTLPSNENDGSNLITYGNAYNVLWTDVPPSTWEGWKGDAILTGCTAFGCGYEADYQLNLNNMVCVGSQSSIYFAPTWSYGQPNNYPWYGGVTQNTSTTYTFLYSPTGVLGTTNNTNASSLAPLYIKNLLSYPASVQDGTPSMLANSFQSTQPILNGKTPDGKSWYVGWPTFYPTFNNWWLTACGLASDVPNANGLFSGSFDITGYTTMLATINVQNACTSTNYDNNSQIGINAWCSNVPFYYRVVGYMTSGGVNNATGWYACWAPYAGILAPYWVQVGYYTFNFQAFLQYMNDPTNYQWQEPLPSLTGATPLINSLNYNYVLIPHGEDPNVYFNYWQFQTADATKNPAVSNQNTVVLIEKSDSHNNIVFTTSNYNNTAQPELFVSLNWVSPTMNIGLPNGSSQTALYGPYGLYAQDGGLPGNPFSTGSIGYSMASALNVPDWNAFGSTAATGGNSPYFVYDKYGSKVHVPFFPCSPSIPIMHPGMAASFVVEGTWFESSDTWPTSKNSTGYYYIANTLQTTWAYPNPDTNMMENEGGGLKNYQSLNFAKPITITTNPSSFISDYSYNWTFTSTPPMFNQTNQFNLLDYQGFSCSAGTQIVGPTDISYAPGDYDAYIFYYVYSN